MLADVHEEVQAEIRQEERQRRIQLQNQSIFSLATNPELATLPLREACARINEMACEVLDAGRCSVLLHDPGKKGLRSIDLYVAAKEEHFEGVVLSDKELPKFFEELQRSRAIVSSDPMGDARFDEFPREYIRERRVKAIMEIPIRRSGKLVGMIGITETRKPRVWQPDEIDYGLDLAQQCARLLEQVDARETEQKQRELERQMLRDMVPDGSKSRGLVEEIGAASQRAAELCHQMLAFSGHGRLSSDQFCLEDVVSEMSHLLRVTASKDADLEFQPAGDLPSMEGDATQIRQVIMNLILNASESLPNGQGRIRVRTTLRHLEPNAVPFGLPIPESGPYLTLEVEDSGEGMEEETLARLFDPFFSTKFTGRGLGLAAVLGIVKAHGGGIEVESTRGIGSCFRVSFPIALAKKESRPSVAAAPKEWTGSGKVLLVDDDETVLHLGSEMLRRLGFEVEVATDGTQAIEKFESLQRELRFVLLDLTMPGLSGEEVYAAMQDADGSIPIIMSSGYTEQDVSQRLGPRGLRGFLQKPYTLLQLRTQVEAVMGDQLRI